MTATPPPPSASPGLPFNAFADFGKLVPGFDFLQNLALQAGTGPASAAASPVAATAASMPGFPGMPSSMGSWIAPTLNVEDLERRIQELKTVQFWLDQNATALRATIQAMELQKMTLATLSSMNAGFGEMVNAFQAKPQAPPPGTAKDPSGKAGGRSSSSKAAAKVFAGLEIPPKRAAGVAEPVSAQPASVDPAAGGGGAAPAAAALVDPVQWWGALTQQFQAIAADALKNAPQPAAATPSAGTAAPVSPSPAQVVPAAGAIASTARAPLPDATVSVEGDSGTVRKKAATARGDTQKPASVPPDSSASPSAQP